MSESKYWLDQAVAEITSKYPKGEIIVSSGVSPSGHYHIGSLREVLTADAICWALKQAGRDVRHLHFVDDFDVLRKIPADVADDYRQHLGKPLSLIPSPYGKGSYADYFLEEFMSVVAALGVSMEVYRSYQLYQDGEYNGLIPAALDAKDDIRRIITKVSGRKLPEQWAPVQILSDEGFLNQWQYVGWDSQKAVVIYKDETGKKGELPVDSGRIKLNWRIDWPMRWCKWGVNVEPFGRDHAARGGAYDTGKRIVGEVYDGLPPFPIPYEFINLAGETKKISASAGDVITPDQALQIMSPEVLRYFVSKSRPAKTLFFDPGLGLYNLIDEFSQIEDDKEHEFREAYEYAVSPSSTDKRTISSVPFKHLVSVYQAASSDESRALDLLARTGYKEAAKEQGDIIKREFSYVSNWLDKYAPEQIKFSVQDKLPKVKLTKTQTEFLVALADALKVAKNVDGQWVHEKIYELKDELNLDTREAFIAIYRVVLGKDWGPKAGWFLAELDRNWLIKRLRLEA